MQLAYPLAYILFCIGAGILYAGILYYRNKSFNATLRWTLATIRAVVVSIICFLLLSPTTKVTNVELEKPKLLWLQDNSLSVGAALDSNAWEETYVKRIENLSKGLDFENVIIPFDETVKSNSEIDFLGTTTNISAALKSSFDTYFNQNIAGVVVASDGIYNRGFDPRYVDNQKSWPIYSWVIGDTSLQLDVKVKNIYHNKIAYRGNQFPIEATISSNVNFEELEVSIKKGKTVLQRKKLNGDKKNQTVKFDLREDKPGLQTYTIAVSPLQGEELLANNERIFYVNIVENKKKILILANQTHPDVAAFQYALKGVEEYELEVKKSAEIIEPISEYNLLIQFQEPSISNRNLNNHIASYKGNVLYVIGKKSNFNYLNKFQKFFEIEQGRTLESVKVHDESTFTRFKLNQETRKFFKTAPPLLVNQSKITFNGSHEDLYRAQIFGINTPQPVFSFGDLGGRSFGLLNGEGIWKWRLYDYQINESHDMFNMLVRQMVRSLVSKEALQRFRIDIPSRIMENRPLNVTAELYNSTFELSVDGLVRVVFTNEQGEEFIYQLNATGDIYKSIIKGLPTGAYSFVSTATLGKETFVKKGNVLIEPVVAELLKTQADFDLLKALAEDNRGKVLMGDNWNALEAELNNLEAPSIAHQNEKQIEWINLKWIFSLILLLLGLEWFLRKRNGAY